VHGDCFAKGRLLYRVTEVKREIALLWNRVGEIIRDLTREMRSVSAKYLAISPVWQVFVAVKK